MNKTIETNQSYQKFKEIFTARHIISQWLSTGSVFLKLFQVLLSQVSSKPVTQFIIIIIIIIIIIKRGWQCKAGRERLTPYQSEDPNPTTPPHRKKEEKGKTVGDKKGASS